MLHSIQRRLVLFVCACGALMACLAVVSVLLFQTADDVISGVLIATVLAFFVLIGLSWLLLNPVLRGLKVLSASVVEADGRGECTVQGAALRELEDIASAFTQLMRNRQEIMSQVSVVMEGLEKGELRHGALNLSQFTATPPENQRILKWS